jgi:hypothetical protein
MRRFSFVLAALVLCGLTSIACKQGVGERCEQPSDCASGYCGNSATVTMMTTAAARMCTAGPGSGVPTFDAAPFDATPSDTGASDTPKGDAVAEAGGDATASDAAVEAAADGSTDTSVDASDAAAGSDASDASADGGADGLEAGPG